MFTSFSTYFLIFWLCQIFKKRKSRCYLWIDIFNLVFLGMTARCVAGCAMIPITVLKTRFESGQYNYTKMSSALLDIYCREGFRGLCCGLTPTLVRDAPYSGLYLMFYTQLKQILSNEHVLKSNPTQKSNLIEPRVLPPMFLGRPLGLWGLRQQPSWPSSLSQELESQCRWHRVKP